SVTMTTDGPPSGAVTTTGSDHGPVPTVFAAATVYVPAARSGVPSTREVPVVLPITPSMQAADSATSTTYDRAPGTGSQLSLTWPSSPVSALTAPGSAAGAAVSTGSEWSARPPPLST